MLKLAFILLFFPTLAFAVPDAPANFTGIPYPNSSWTLDETLPFIIYDDGIEGWLSDPLMGNFATKSKWYGGPRLEVGGMHIPANCVQGDGKIYCDFAPSGFDSSNFFQLNSRSTASLYSEGFIFPMIRFFPFCGVTSQLLKNL